MSNSLVTVPFHGDHLDATQDENGKVWAGLRRRCCENFGISMEGQLAKLKGKPWAVMKEIFMTGPDGKQYAMTAIDLDSLPMWLATIDARKVKEHVREKLAQYQREAARVLADHFFRRTPQPAGLSVDQLRSVIAEEIDRRLGDGSRHAGLPMVPRVTVKERCRFKGWMTTSPKQRAEIRRLANWLLDLRHAETPDLVGQVCIYAGHQIACLDEAIDRTLAEYRRLDRGGSAGLFSYDD